MFIVGLKLSSSTTASVWQPSQPIFTLGLALLLGWETVSVLKVLGIMFAIGGAVFMILFDVPESELSASITGNMCFVLNCLASSSYVICTKPLLKHYSGLIVCAWAYVSATCFMTVTALSITVNSDSLNFVCPDCDGDGWQVPTAAIWALCYWVTFQSVGAWGLLTWANKHIDGSVCSAYSVLQPLTSDVLTSILVAWGVNLELPGWNEFGAIGILIGLAMILYDNRRMVNKQAKRATPEHDEADTKLLDPTSVHSESNGSAPTVTIYSPINEESSE